MAALRAKYWWPGRKPDDPVDPHGWCSPIHADVLPRYINPTTKVIVELGAWLGASTRVLLNLAPESTVICVDHWLGSRDMKNKPQALARLPRLYETFLVNQWPWRDRVIPLRDSTLAGLDEIHDLGIVPELIYFDSEHTTAHVRRELLLAHEHFPTAIFYGDDWAWVSVRNAVEAFARERGYDLHARGNAWALERRP